VKVMACITDLT